MPLPVVSCAPRQTQREQSLAKQLAGRLTPWCSGEAAAQGSFVADALLEYGKLAETSLGPQMLLSIGLVYEHVDSWCRRAALSTWW